MNPDAGRQTTTDSQADTATTERRGEAAPLSSPPDEVMISGSHGAGSFGSRPGLSNKKRERSTGNKKTQPAADEALATASGERIATGSRPPSRRELTAAGRLGPFRSRVSNETHAQGPRESADGKESRSVPLILSWRSTELTGGEFVASPVRVTRKPGTQAHSREKSQQGTEQQKEAARGRAASGRGSGRWGDGGISSPMVRSLGRN